MKGKWVWGVAVVAAALFVVPTALAVSNPTLDVADTVAPGTTIPFVVTADHAGNATLYQYFDDTCSIGKNQIGSTHTLDGSFQTTWNVLFGTSLPTGPYYFNVIGPGGLYSDCVTVTLAVPKPAYVPPESSVFLCYNATQVNPEVFKVGVATKLMAGGGYWQPYAVAGTVAGGTNIGAYHLVCSLATGQAAGDQFVGAGGDVSSPGVKTFLSGILGWYPAVPK